jgi:hypothetical protein
MGVKPKISLTIRNLALLALVATFAFASGVIAARPSSTPSLRAPLGAKQARDLIRNLSGVETDPDQVRIKSITPGMGDSAIVEAELKTAFRFIRDPREGHEWRIAEVRVADRHWDSVELLQSAITKEKVERTRKIMRELSGVLEAYHTARSHFPVAESINLVFDELIPAYSSHPPQLDLWGMPFAYRGTNAGYRLSSSGPDRKPDTPDDLVVEGGTGPR